MPATRWYVNLAPADNAGKKIALVAKRKMFHKSGTTMRSVNWALVRDLKGLDASLLRPGDAALRDTTTTEQADRRFSNELDVGVATNVSYQVTATKSTGGNNITFDKSYVTWRKVFYDVVYMRGTKRHYDAIKEQFRAAWAEVGYEFVENRTVEALVDEPQTNSDAGALLPHLYGDSTLSKDPFHIRMVICKDIVSGQDKETTWEMTNTTARGTGLTQVWSTGNVVHFSSPIQLQSADPTLCSVRTLATVAVPATALARPAAHRATIDLTDHTLANVLTALTDNPARKVKLKAKLRAVKSKVTTLKTMLDFNSKNAPMQVGSTRLTLAANGPAWELTIVDTAHTWSTPPSKSATIEERLRNKFGGGQWGSGAGKTDLTVARTDDHTLVVTIPDVYSSHAILAATSPAPSEFMQGVTRRVRGLLLELGLLWDAGAMENEAIDTEVTEAADALVRFDRGASTLEIKDASRAFDATHPLVEASLLYATAPVTIPGAAVALANNGKQASFNLAADPSLNAVCQAFAAGSTLEFKATLHSVQSCGGYSPTRDRQFVALTTRKSSPAETDATTQRRLRLVAMHELGHAHGLVPNATEYGSGASRSNGAYYTDEYGGQGPHCSHNAKLSPSGPSYGQLPTTSGQVYLHAGAGNLCIMYHQLDLTHMGDSFCPTCQEALRTNPHQKLQHT